MPFGDWKPLRLPLTPYKVGNGKNVDWAVLLDLDPVEQNGVLYLRGVDGWAFDVVQRFRCYYSSYLNQLQTGQHLLTVEGLLAFAWSRLRQDPKTLDGAETLALEATTFVSSYADTLKRLHELGLLPVMIGDVADGLRFHTSALRDVDPPPAIDDTDVDVDAVPAEEVHEDGHPF